MCGGHALHQASPPLKAITDDFRKALAGKRLDLAKDQNAKKIKRMKRALDTTINAVAAEVKQLENAVKLMDEKMVNKGFVRHRETGAVHRILTTINEAGFRASACCGWKYGQRDFELQTSAPTTRRTTCGTCLAALRATLQE